MVYTIEDQLGELYSRIADKLNITETQYLKAEKTYNTVGEYLREKVSKEIDVFPQGSMNLGTVVKPSDDSEDFDVDLVARINDGYLLTCREIKNKIGDALKENERYRQKIAKEGEGKRCWTIQYDEFHMDILPCVPLHENDAKSTEIRLTHKLPTGCYVPKYSNPEGYRDWFLQQANKKPKGFSLAMESRVFAELRKLPLFKYRYALQQAVQLLKRHRNIYFDADDKDKPISIIITTLVAEAYDGEENVYCLLANVLPKIFVRLEESEEDGEWFVFNPALKSCKENFAEKWNAPNSSKAQSFVRWLHAAYDDLVVKPKNTNQIDLAKWLEKKLGEKPTRSAFSDGFINMRALRENERLGLDSKGFAVPIGINGLVANVQKIKPHTFYGN